MYNPNGPKRKCPDDKEGCNSRDMKIYNERCQEILKISYEKMNSLSRDVDSNLLRYILLLNTSRNVEREIERYRINNNYTYEGPFLPAINYQVSTLDPAPSSYYRNEGLSPPTPDFPKGPYTFDMDSDPVLPSDIDSQISPSGNANDAISYNYNGCLGEVDSAQSGKMAAFTKTAYDRNESCALGADETNILISPNWGSVNCQVSTQDPRLNSHAIDEGMPPQPLISLPSPCTSDMDPKPALPSAINSQVSTSESAFSNMNGATGYDIEHDHCLVEFGSSQSERLRPFVKTVHNLNERDILWADEIDRLTSLNWSSVLNFNSDSYSIGSSCSFIASTNNGTLTCCQSNEFNCDSSMNGISVTSITENSMCNTENSLHTLRPPVMDTSSNSLSATYSSSPYTSSSVHHARPTSGSSSSEDEIFGEIDMTVYDFDLLPLSLPNVQMAPISVEELMRSLSNN